MATVAGVSVGFAGAAPTGSPAVDVLLSMATGFVVTTACARARRWTWPILAGVAVVLAGGLWPTVLALVALGSALHAAAFTTRRDRLTGALIGALSVQALFRGTAIEAHGVSALIGTVACILVLFSAYRTFGRRSRTRVRQAVYFVAAVAILGVVGLGVSVLAAKNDIDNGVSRSRAGLEAARAGNQEVAQEQWAKAGNAFSAADAALDNPWLKIAYVVPIVSQHARAISTTAHHGAEVATAAARAADVAPYRDLRSSDGRLNLPLIREMYEPIAETAAAMEAADTGTRKISSPWLLPQLSNQLATFDTELRDAMPEAIRARDALAVAPELLGGNGTRRYLVLFGTPSESRGLGGFIGSWAELDVTDGSFELARHGKVEDLNDATPYEGRKIVGQEEYLSRYGYLQPARYIQNVSASPDFPTVADVAQQLYPQAGGTKVDGTFYVDPFALQAFLELTGPIQVEGIPQPLTGENAAQFLIHDQYLQFPDNEHRDDLLSDVSEATFDALTSRDLPTIAAISDTLSPMVHQKRLLFTVDDPAADRFLAGIGMRGALPAPDGSDFLSIRSANGSGNKIDYYLRRAVEYSSRVDPTTGRTLSTATVTLTNTAPTSGAPAYVLGNQDLVNDLPDPRPMGSNTVVLSVYSPLRPTALTIDGTSAGIQVESELGYTVSTVSITIPSGASKTLVFSLEGTLSATRNHRLTLDSQPLVAPDESTLRVRPLDSGSSLTPSSRVSAGTWTRTATLTENITSVIGFAPR